MSTLKTPPMAEHFDLALDAPGDERLGELHSVGKYWCWAQSFAPETEPLRLLEWTDAGIVDLTTQSYSLHVVRAGTRHLIQGLFDSWLTSDADHVWLQVPRSDTRYYALIAGGRTGVNRRHAVAWHCQECGERLAGEDLEHDGQPAAFLRAQADAVARFNADVAGRTCARCGAVHPPARGFAATPGDVISSGLDHPTDTVRVADGSVPFGTTVAQLHALEDDVPVPVRVGGHELMLIRQGAEVFAVASVCPHRGGPLVEGAVDAGIITCPWHRFRFDARTGGCVTNASLRARTYPVAISGDDVIVTHDSQGGEA